MKAKCPNCEKGCEKCKDGFIEVSIAKGKLFTRHCDDCGFDNGGRVVPEGKDPPEGKPAPCVMCKSQNTRWMDTGVNTGDF